MTWRALTAAAVVGLVTTAFAQNNPQRIAAQQELVSARALAVRPNDERLSCDQLNRETAAILSARNVRQYVAEQSTARGGDIFDAFVAARLANEIALLEAQQNHLDDEVSKLRRLAAKMQELLPQFMRGERVRDLGRARNCPFTRAPQSPAAPGSQTRCGARC